MLKLCAARHTGILATLSKDVFSKRTVNESGAVRSARYAPGIRVPRTRVSTTVTDPCRPLWTPAIENPAWPTRADPSTVQFLKRIDTGSELLFRFASQSEN